MCLMCQAFNGLSNNVYMHIMANALWNKTAGPLSELTRKCFGIIWCCIVIPLKRGRINLKKFIIYPMQTQCATKNLRNDL